MSKYYQCSLCNQIYVEKGPQEVKKEIEEFMKKNEDDDWVSEADYYHNLRGCWCSGGEYKEITEEQMEALVGKYVKYYNISEEEDFAMCFEGTIEYNDKKFWDDNEPPEGKYVLIDPELGAMESFDDLNDVFDLQVIHGKERFFTKVKCWKCGEQIIEAHKFCPHCGKKNKYYREG